MDITLSPEMKSTGEVMGIDKTFGIAYLKSQLAAGNKLSSKGKILMVAHCIRDEGLVIRIISARKATKRESNKYWKEKL